jgi:DNA-binding NtrC family response regulator
MNRASRTHPAFSHIITRNREMHSIFQYLESIAQSRQPILLTGETGVGKELFAQSVHALSGVTGPWVVVNVAGLDDVMFSDTLFGHARGAFTGADRSRRGLIETAAEGTLFLDEIGDLPQPSQIKLLRLLQNGEYMPLGEDRPRHCKAHIVAATNQDLWLLQRKGGFRKDLNFRLRTHHVHLPPLRERAEDIPALVDHFLVEAARDMKKRKPTPPKELYTLLQTYPFPGNVRELRSMVYDAVGRHRSKVLSLDVFKEHMDRDNGDRSDTPRPMADLDESAPFRGFQELPSIKEMTRMLVAEAMRRSNGNQSIAARMLGISQPALSKRLKTQALKARASKAAAK